MEAREFKKLFKVTKPLKVGNDKLMEIAYHESGHVLIDLLYGFPGTTTTIIPDKIKGSAGSHQWLFNESGDYDFDDYLFGKGITDWSQQKKIEFLVLCLMGGIIAGSFYSGEFNWIGAESDLNQIIDVFVSYGIFDIPDLQPYWDKAFNMIQKNIDRLKKIAGDLYKYQTLDRDYFEK
jgi:hypothetical protein